MPASKCTFCLLRSRIIVIVTVLLGLLLSPSVSPLKAVSEAPQTQWEKTYGPLYGFSVAQTSDGGYAIAGVEAVWETASRGGGSWTNNTFLLIKTDAVGEVRWRKNYTRGNAYSVSLTNDGGYVLAGRGESNLVKVDSEGNMQWNKTYTAFDDGGMLGMVYSVIQTKDDGYALVGTSESKGYTEGILIKTDSNGMLQWNKTYGSPSKMYDAYSIVETDDGGYAITGQLAPGAGYGDAWLLKTDASGNVQWEKTYGGQETEWALSFAKTLDGGYLLVGKTDSFGAGSGDGWAVKVDSQGNMQWNKTYGGAGEDFFTDVVQASGGGYALAGITDSISTMRATVVVKLSASGELEWEKSFPSYNSPESMIAASDGGYVFAGNMGSGSPDDMVWAVKIAPDYSPQETEPSPSEPFPTTWIVAVAIVAVTVVGVGLLVYLRKRKR